MSNRQEDLYITDISNSIKQIEEYTENMTIENFDLDRKTQDAVIRNLEIIGEASKYISSEFKEKYSHIPWNQMISMRNKVIHEYFGVDTEILWQTIKVDLVNLKKELESITLKESPDPN